MSIKNSSDHESNPQPSGLYRIASTNRATACPTPKIAICFKTGLSYHDMSIFPEFSLTSVHEYAELPA
jgi:hypothetical protein